MQKLIISLKLTTSIIGIGSMKYFNKSACIVFLVISSIILFSSCSKKKEEIAQVNSSAPVKVAYPQNTKLEETLQLNANTVFLKKEIVRATFQGFIEKTYKNIGDKINAGETIFSIRTKESAADRSSQNISDSKFKGVVEIKAKSSGVLSELNHFAGDYVSDGEQVAVIANLSSLRIQLNAPYQNAGSIKLGSRCVLILPNGKLLDGTIVTKLPTVDAASQTQTFLIIPKQSANLPENLNLTVKIPVRTIDNALTVPKSALMTDETQSLFWVMKLINGSTAVKTPVKKGMENDSLVQLLNTDITVNDRVIVEGAFGLPDTSNVAVGK
jgi:multidrug efflux pump subunit AcrA (membrane-fusion protein)